MAKTIIRITEKVGYGVYHIDFGNGLKKLRFAVDIRSRFGDDIADEVERFYADEGKGKWKRGYNLVMATDDELSELEKKAKEIENTNKNYTLSGGIGE